MLEFKNKILFVGYGAVAQCALPILVKHLKTPCANITVMDFEDRRDVLAPWLKRGVKFARKRVTRENMGALLGKYLSAGDVLIDLAWNIECLDMLNWCHDNKVLYANTSVEEWDPYANIHKKTPFQKSLYYKQMQIRDMVSRWNGDSTTSVLDHGANPGLISHFTKKGLTDIALKSIKDRIIPKQHVRAIERLIQDKNFARLSMRLGVKVIHISERDTQITDEPKRIGEFVGTWSIEGLREEGISPAEIGWGMHEKDIPLTINTPPYGPKNQVFLSQMGMNTWVRTWVPHLFH